MEILTTRDADRWVETLETSGIYDFHHLPAFHRLAEMQGEGSPIMLSYRERGHIIALPLLVRDVDVAGAVNGLRDATSVYGYAGPVVSSDTPSSVLRHFQGAMLEYCASAGIISVFSRLHPLIEQSPILEGCGQIVDTGVTTSIDLTAPAAVQLSDYRKSNRYEIRRLEKLGFSCRRAGPEGLGDFARIYHDTMRELNADSQLFYSDEYLSHLLDWMPDIMHLYLCMDGETVCCVGLFSLCKGILQYHLAGTDSAYRKLSPMKLMLDTVREWGNETGARIFHLGGGVGARRDSLYEFKRGFAGQEHTFQVWKHVVNQAIYDEICDQALRNAGTRPSEDYFPMYRHPAFRR